MSATAPRPRRYRPSYRHKQTYELTGGSTRTSVELLQTDLSRWTWTDFVALCDINKAVWTSEHVCVCYKHKERFPPSPCGATSKYVFSVPECDSDSCFQHLHVMVTNELNHSSEGTLEVTKTVQGMLDMVARSTTQFVAFGTLEVPGGSETHKKKLPFKASFLQQQIPQVMSHSDPKRRKRTVVFWNLSVTTAQCQATKVASINTADAAAAGATTDDKGSRVEVKFCSCDFDNSNTKDEFESVSDVRLQTCMNRLYPWQEKAEVKLRVQEPITKTRKRKGQQVQEHTTTTQEDPLPSSPTPKNDKEVRQSTLRKQMAKKDSPQPSKSTGAALTVARPTKPGVVVTKDNEDPRKDEKSSSKPKVPSMIQQKLAALTMVFLMALYFLWLSRGDASGDHLRGAANRES